MRNDEKVPIVTERPQDPLFGPPPLLEGEDPAAYDQLHTRITESVKPKDVLEEMWVRDVVDLTWHILRLRRLKAAFLSSVQYQGLREILEPLKGVLAASDLANQWNARDPKAIKEINSLLGSKDLTMDLADAQALARSIVRPLSAWIESF